LGIETTAHDDDAFGGLDEVRVDGECEDNVCEGSGGIDGHLLRMRVDLTDEEVGGVLVAGFRLRGAFAKGRNFPGTVRFRWIERSFCRERDVAGGAAAGSEACGLTGEVHGEVRFFLRSDQRKTTPGTTGRGCCRSVRAFGGAAPLHRAMRCL